MFKRNLVFSIFHGEENTAQYLFGGLCAPPAVKFQVCLSIEVSQPRVVLRFHYITDASLKKDVRV